MVAIRYVKILSSKNSTLNTDTSSLYPPIFFHHLRLYFVFDSVVQVVEKVEMDDVFQLIDGHGRRLQILVFGDILHQEADGGIRAVWLNQEGLEEGIRDGHFVCPDSAELVVRVDGSADDIDQWCE